MIKLKITTILSLLCLLVSSVNAQLTVLDKWERINDLLKARLVVKAKTKKLEYDSIDTSPFIDTHVSRAKMLIKHWSSIVVYNLESCKITYKKYGFLKTDDTIKITHFKIFGKIIGVKSNDLSNAKNDYETWVLIKRKDIKCHEPWMGFSISFDNKLMRIHSGPNVHTFSEI